MFLSFFFFYLLFCFVFIFILLNILWASCICGLMCAIISNISSPSDILIPHMVHLLLFSQFLDILFFFYLFFALNFSLKVSIDLFLTHWFFLQWEIYFSTWNLLLSPSKTFVWQCILFICFQISVMLPYQIYFWLFSNRFLFFNFGFLPSKV